MRKAVIPFFMSTKIKLILLVFSIGLGGCYTSVECVCPDIYNPVCGANGKDYQSPCPAECDDVPYTYGECPVYGIGTVKFTGDTLCGFVIQIIDQQYKPQQLAGEFQEHGKTVNLRYRRMLNYYDCLSQNMSFQEIVILEITSFP
jgi:hypothetical protein